MQNNESTKINPDLFLFIHKCLGGDLAWVKERVEAGYTDFLYHYTRDLVMELIAYGQLEVIEYLVSKGLNLLRGLPDSLHWKLHEFYELSFYGDLPDSEMQRESNEHDFVEVAKVVRKFGYPINIPVSPDSSFGKSSDGHYRIGNTELDMAIHYYHPNAISYLRRTGGKRRSELEHVAGGFDFFGTEDDQIQLKALIFHEIKKTDEALKLMQHSRRTSWNKLVVASLLNQYEPLIERLTKDEPVLVNAYKSFLGL